MSRPQWREPEANTSYLLAQAHADLARRILDGVVAAGHTLRAAHSAVFVNIDSEGTRLTALAERASMTPQAMGELVDDLVARGYLARTPDPTDRRAKLIVLTERGEAAVQAAFDTIIAVEADLEALLGRTGLTRLHTALRRIAQRSEGFRARGGA
jgi:DNA-binding MarR family transcriptional regulator